MESNRVPSIHISLPALQKALRKLFKDIPFIEPDDWDRAGEKLFKILKKYNLDHRSVVITNERMERKVIKILKAGKSETDQVCMMISMYRRNKKKTKLYSTKKITPEHKDYSKAKELTAIILNYAERYNLDFNKAIIQYLDYTVPKITSSLNFVNKLCNMEEMVIMLTEAQLELDNDKDIAETLAIRDFYDQKITEKTNIKQRTTDPTDIVHFKLVSEITDELDIPYEIYVEAQFHGLNWTDTFPTPKQMVGDNATKRLQKYMFEKKIKVKSYTGVKVTILDKLKNLKK